MPLLLYPGHHVPLLTRSGPIQNSHRALSALRKPPTTHLRTSKPKPIPKPSITTNPLSKSPTPTTPPRPTQSTHRRPFPFLPPYIFKPLSWLFTSFAAYTFFSFTHTHLFSISTVTGASMSPFLNTSHDDTTTLDRVLVNKYQPLSNLHHGTIIAFWTPHNPERMATKRIVAMEGDRVVTKGAYPVPMEVVPVGHLWVEGDDEERSLDSNTYGPVSRGLVVGRVVGVVWPVERAGRVRWEDWRGCDRVVKDFRKVEKVEFY